MAHQKRAIATNSARFGRLAYYLVSASEHPPKSFTQKEHDKIAANISLVNSGWITQVNMLLDVPIQG